MMSVVDSTIEKSIFGGKAWYSCFGRPVDWRAVRQMEHPEHLRAIQSIVCSLLHHNINRLFMMCPIIDFDRDYSVGKKPLNISFTDTLDGWDQLKFPSLCVDDRTVELYCRWTDGVILAPGSAVIMTTADCPVIIADDVNDKHVAVLHGSRDALECPEAAGRFFGRKPPNIIEVWHSHFGSVGHSAISVKVVCGIGANDFRHPEDDSKFGEINRRRKEYYAQIGCPCMTFNDGLDLFAFIRHEFAALGVDPNQVVSDGVNTFFDKDLATGKLLWHSYRFNKDSGCNAVLVVNFG